MYASQTNQNRVGGLSSLSKAAAVILTLFLLIVMLLCSYPSYDDHAAAIGDTVDYQTLAVNLAERHIFPVSGLLLPDTAYHFRIINGYPGAWTSAEIEAAKPGYTFYRNPIYPLFCAAVYSICGVRPAVLYRIQLLLLVFALSSLPLIGRAIAGLRGVAAGAVSALLTLFLMQRYAYEVQTQALVLPYTIGLWWILTRFIPRYDIRSSMIIGVYLGIGLLLKNFYIPIAVLVCCYRIGRFRDLRALLLPVIIVLTILPYSAYIYHLRGTSQPFVTITDQGGDVLLDANNDFSTDGDWHSGGAAATLFYQQPEIKSESAMRQVISYAVVNPSATLLSLSAKVRLGLLSRWPPILFLLVLMVAYFISFVEGKTRAIVLASAVMPLIAIAALYILQRSVFYELQAMLNAALHHSFLPLLLLLLCYLILPRVGEKYLSHVASWILVVGFISLTLIFYGSDRIVGMIDFIWLFYAVLMGLDMIGQTAE